MPSLPGLSMEAAVPWQGVWHTGKVTLCTQYARTQRNLEIRIGDWEEGAVALAILTKKTGLHLVQVIIFKEKQHKQVKLM